MGPTLLALYDAETGQVHLYVNGQEKGEAVEATSADAFQIGQARDTDGYRDLWHGDVADVRVHDRVVVPDEVAELARRKASLVGHWSLTDSTDGTAPSSRAAHRCGSATARRPTRSRTTTPAPSTRSASPHPRPWSVTGI